MANRSLKQKWDIALSVVKKSFLTMLFSFLPMIIIYGLEWGKLQIPPGFSFLFDSGKLISIWIPLLVMLIFSFYDVRGKHKYNPNWEDIAFFSVVIVFIVSFCLFLVFYYELLPYSDWVKWLSIGIIFYLFVVIAYANFLENASRGDLQSERAKEQELINNKVNEL